MIKFCKVRNVQSPHRAYDTSAGIDFFIPINLKDSDLISKNKTPFKTYVNPDKTIKAIGIPSLSRILIPSGIHVKFEDGYALIAFNKSGVSTKLGLIAGACVVDSEYCSEVHLSIINTTDKEVIINAGDKIIQFILMPILLDNPIEVSNINDLYINTISERGSGGFGSTGMNAIETNKLKSKRKKL